MKHCRTSTCVAFCECLDFPKFNSKCILGLSSWKSKKCEKSSQMDLLITGEVDVRVFEFLPVFCDGTNVFDVELLCSERFLDCIVCDIQRNVRDLRQKRFVRRCLMSLDHTCSSCNQNVVFRLRKMQFMPISWVLRLCNFETGTSYKQVL